MKTTYPIIIEPVDADGLHLVRIPDFDGYTQGHDLSECLAMAQDYINLAVVDLEDDNKPVPQPTTIDIKHLNDGEIPTLVSIDTVAYRKEISTKSVKKTLTIPSWLNTKAEKNGINFSQTLQDALIEKLY